MRHDVIVRLVVGAEDDTTPTVVPGLGHNIMFQPVVFEAIERLLSLPAFASR